MRAQESTDYERLGSPNLGLPDAIAQSVGFLGPVFSAAFLIPLVVGVASATNKGGGVAAPFSVLVAGVGVVALGWLVSRYAREVHAAGGLYDYVARGLGERMGVATGILYYSGILLLSVGLIVLIGGYLHDTIRSEFSVTPLPQWAWSALVVGVVLAILHTGVRISTRTQLVLALVSFLVVLGFFVMVIVKLGPRNSWGPFEPASSAQGWSGIFFGVLYGVLLFVGFETSANLGEETTRPRRSIPIAVLATAFIAAAFYVLAAYAQVAGFHYSIRAISSAAGAPLFALGAAGPSGYGGHWIDRLLELVVLLDMLAVALGTGVAGSRGVFALARDRRLPSPLASVSKRHGTPLGALVLLGVLAVANIVLTQDWSHVFALPREPHYFSIFDWDSTFGAFALVCVYLFLCFGSIYSFMSGKGRSLALLAALVGIAITGGAVFGAFDKVPRPTLYAPISALCVFVVGLLVALATKGRTPASIELEGLSEPEPDPPETPVTVLADAPDAVSPTA